MNDQTNPGRNYLGQETAPSYMPTSDERTMAVLCHVLTLFFWILPPLIIYLLKKDESSFIAEHAKESMNFQITWAIIALVLFVTLIGILLLWVVGIVILVLVIVATIKASESKMYRYPFTLRLIK
jgi:uncharacterized Tic20 family protein